MWLLILLQAWKKGNFPMESDFYKPRIINNFATEN